MYFREVRPGDWAAVQTNFQRAGSIVFGTGASPTFAGLTLSGLTASTLVGANASKALESVTIGTGLAYSRPTLSLSHLGIESLTDPNADKILFWDDSETACKWLACGNSVAITTTTLDTIQDIRNTASPTFEAVILGSDVVLVNDAHGVRADTDDGSDNQLVYFSGGGAFGNSRGACFACYGNEYAGDPSGKLYLYGGNVANGDVIFNIGNAERGRFRATGLLVTGAISVTGIAIITGALTASNYTAANLLTACATNAGELDFTAASKKLDVEDNAVVSQDYSSDASPVFANLNLSAGELTCGSINRETDTLTLEVGDIAQLSLTTTAAILAQPTTAPSINLTTNTGLILVDGTTFLANDGTANLFLGTDVFDNDSGSYNIGIGFEAGKNNDTTGAGEEGDANIYIGYRAGYGGTAEINNTGYGNIAIGSASLYLNNSGYHNVGIGRSSLYDNTTGDFNMAIGAYTCGKNTIGDRNVAIGYQALYYNIEGFDNIGIGEAAGRGTSGQSQWWNVLIGMVECSYRKKSRLFNPSRTRKCLHWLSIWV
jgi:hypothetical protein